MTDENLLVSWQDFETSSPDIIRNLWKDEDFSDVTLATGDGRLFRAHRVILSSATTKLRSILCNPGKCENLFLYLPDVQSSHLSKLLEFIYQGRCEVKQADFEEFMSCGRYLGIKNLENTDTEKQNQHLTSYYQRIGVSGEDKNGVIATELTETHQTKPKSVECPAESFEYKDTERKPESQQLTYSEQCVGVSGEKRKGDIVEKYTETPQTKSEVCPVCRKIFSTNELMNKHVRRQHKTNTKHAEKVKKCDFSKYETGVEKKLHEHIERRLKGRKCTLCGRDYTSAANLKRHFFDKHAEKIYKCDCCEYETAVEKELHDHIERIHKGRVFNCEQCSFQADRKTVLNYHIKSIHDMVKMKCDQCDYECEYKSGCLLKMRKHKATMHGENVYNCDQCDYQSDNTNVARHKKFVHNKENYIACNQCDFKSNYPSLVEYHKKGVHEGVRWPCSVCGNQFKSPMHLKKHTNEKHEKIIHRKTCASCDFIVESTSSEMSRKQLRKHEDLVHSKIDYQCERCDYTSKTRDTLKNHIKTKHGREEEASFVCDQCSYTSKQSVHLDIHVRSKHRGELFKCDMCDYEATQLSNLVRHKRFKHLVEEK